MVDLYSKRRKKRILVLINECLRDVEEKQRKTNINRQIDSETFSNNCSSSYLDFYFVNLQTYVTLCQSDQQHLSLVTMREIIKGTRKIYLRYKRLSCLLFFFIFPFSQNSENVIGRSQLLSLIFSLV